MKTKFLLLLLLPFALLLFRSVAWATSPISYEIIVSASLGEPKLTLFGYASPQAKVQLEGNRVYEETTALSDGYFLFDRIFLPRADPDYPELCLIAQPENQNQLATFPTCLPPLPSGPFNLRIGPVLLPPALQLEKNRFLPNEQVQASGFTLPNAPVELFLANELSSSSPLANLIRPVLAYRLPVYQTKTNNQGYFEFNLPVSQPTSWRVFASAQYAGQPTPKSHTLTFQLLSWWAYLWLRIKALLGLLFAWLGPYWWLLVLFLEAVMIVYLLRRKKKSAEADSYLLR